jgi:hypothetical protein
MQTTDEETNMLELFGDAVQAETPSANDEGVAVPTPAAGPSQTPGSTAAARAEIKVAPPILTEVQALRELPAIPLHFSSSYALVKPYVEGFESNLLDAPSLKHVRINTGWLAPPPEQSARLAHRPTR